MTVFEPDEHENPLHVFVRAASLRATSLSTPEQWSDWLITPDAPPLGTVMVEFQLDLEVVATPEALRRLMHAANLLWLEGRVSGLTCELKNEAQGVLTAALALTWRGPRKQAQALLRTLPLPAPTPLALENR